MKRMTRLAVPPLALLFGLAACKPSRTELDKKYAAELTRGNETMRAAWEAVDAAPHAAAGAPCEKAGLKLSVVDPKLVPGTVEIVMHDLLTLDYDKPRWEKGTNARLEGPTFHETGPLEKAAGDVVHRADHPEKTFDGEPEALEASRAITHLIVIRATRPATLEAFLFDVEAKKIVCGFSVEGQPDPGVEDRDMVASGRDGDVKFTTSAVESSKVRNVPKQMEAELFSRFGFGFKPDAVAPSVPAAKPLTPEMEETRRLANELYAQRDQEAPACHEKVEDSPEIDLATLRRNAGVETPPELWGVASHGYREPKTFTKLKALTVIGAIELTPPAVRGDGSWSAARLKVRGLQFADGKLVCRRDWELVTPDDLKAGTSHGQLTAKSTRDAAAEYFSDQLTNVTMPLD